MNCKSCSSLGNAFAESAHQYLKRVSLFNDAVEAWDTAQYRTRKREMDEARIDMAVAELELKRHRQVHPLN